MVLHLGGQEAPFYGNLEVLIGSPEDRALGNPENPVLEFDNSTVLAFRMFVWLHSTKGSLVPVLQTFQKIHADRKVSFLFLESLQLVADQFGTDVEFDLEFLQLVVGLFGKDVESFPVYQLLEDNLPSNVWVLVQIYLAQVYYS